MSFVQKVNPFKGVLCEPYYHLWICILVSWIVGFTQVLFDRFRKRYYEITNSDDTVKSIILHELREETKQQLNAVELPNEIILIILSMIKAQY